MTTFSKHLEVKASQKNVWEVVADLGGICKYNPSVSHSYYNSQQKSGIGASRICELNPAGKVEEVATKWIEGTGFTLKVIPLEKAPPIKNFYASLALQVVEEHCTKVSIMISYDTKMGPIGRLLDSLVIKAQMQTAIDQLLKGLQLHIEHGLIVEDTTALNTLLEAA